MCLQLKLGISAYIKINIYDVDFIKNFTVLALFIGVRYFKRGYFFKYEKLYFFRNKNNESFAESTRFINWHQTSASAQDLC